MFGAASTFVGNGETLKTVSGMFAHNSLFGVKNQGDPTAMDFRFAFFQSLDDYVNDPFLESPSAPNVFHRFDTASNQS